MILKARWRCLLSCLDHNIENLPDVIISCCVLHCICQMRGDFYIANDDILEHTLQQERERTQRREEHEFDGCQYVTGHPDGLCKC